MTLAARKARRTRHREVYVACVLLSLVLPPEARSVRAIPDDNLAYPVLVTLSTGPTGSAFFLNGPSATYLITAKHVLYGEKGEDLLAPAMELRAYGKDPADATPLMLKVDLLALKRDGHVRRHPTADVAVVRIGTSGDTGGQRTTQFAPAISVASAPKAGFVGVGIDGLKRFDDVLVSNDVLIFGYPTSIGLRQVPQLDYFRPLLRRGLVAGKNASNRTIVIDCPVYKGNSGGPVLEIDSDGLNRRFRVIGLVSQFVPVAETWLNLMHGYSNTNIANSGYAIVTPIDSVLELVDEFTKH